MSRIHNCSIFQECQLRPQSSDQDLKEANPISPLDE